MFFTDATAAGGCLLLAIVLFVAIHVFSPPKPWGDVTRNIHYWLTRKYLLRLDERKTNLKHWRPQVLLLANNPRTEWNLIIFCNSLKKGGLYILGHCIKGDFSECLSELRRQQIAWLKLVDLSGVKSFVDVVIANDEREGARSLILSAGLGGMRPNIVVLGFPRDLQAHARKTVPARVDPIPSDKSVKAPCHHQEGSEITIRGPHAIEDGIHETKSGAQLKHLPTDATRKESPITGEAYVGIIEDALALNKAVAVAYGFDVMQLPGPSSHAHYEKTKEKQYIDLWPVQIQSPDADPEHAWDTYTMILNMGTILSLTGTWKSHQLRVSVFVEDPAEVEEERKRVRSLLDNLRIPATLRVFCLSDGSVASYEAIVAGKLPTPSHIETALKGDPWWNALKELRAKDAEARKAAEAKRKSQAMEQQAAATAIPKTSASTSTDGRRSKKEQ
jgi:solute carrier family 12 (potassium/chloride transporters), member 9